MKSHTGRYIEMIIFGAVLLIVSTLLMLNVISRQCHGQCFQTHDKDCQERCNAKEFCPMAGGDQ